MFFFPNIVEMIGFANLSNLADRGNEFSFLLDIHEKIVKG